MAAHRDMACLVHTGWEGLLAFCNIFIHKNSNVTQGCQLQKGIIIYKILKKKIPHRI